MPIKEDRFGVLMLSMQKVNNAVLVEKQLNGKIRLRISKAVFTLLSVPNDQHNFIVITPKDGAILLSAKKVIPPSKSLPSNEVKTSKSKLFYLSNKYPIEKLFYHLTPGIYLYPTYWNENHYEMYP